MNDLELIERFRSHVPPPSAERVAAARAALCAEYEHTPRALSRSLPRAGRRRALAALVSVPAVAAVAAVVIVGGLSGGGTPIANAAIIRHAVAAVAPPPDEILVIRIEGGGFVNEWWQLTSPPYSFLGDKGHLGAAPEYASDGTTSSYYDPTTNTIYTQQQGTKAATRQGLDPLAAIRQGLQDGEARVLGDAQVDGIAAYKIQLADNKQGFDSQNTIVYVDQSTYRPIMLDDPQSDGSVVQLRVVTFEYVPATSANLQSLSLTARHPTAPVVNLPASGSPGPGK